MANASSKNSFLQWGYKAGIVMAFLCILLGALYLFLFQLSSPDPSNLKTEFQLLSITAERRLLLLSTAMFIAMSFGFLGFALFLIQAKGDVDAEVSNADYKIKLARLSPGLFVIACATVIIVFAATFRIDFGLTKKSNSGGEATESSQQYSEPDSPGATPPITNDELVPSKPAPSPTDTIE